MLALIAAVAMLAAACGDDDSTSGTATPGPTRAATAKTAGTPAGADKVVADIVAKGGKGVDQSFDDLHNQFHAIDNGMCRVEKSVKEQPAYALAVTHNRELKTIFKRLWKFKNDQPQRDQHLDLFVSELQEMRQTLQTLR